MKNTRHKKMPKPCGKSTREVVNLVPDEEETSSEKGEDDVMFLKAVAKPLSTITATTNSRTHSLAVEPPPHHSCLRPTSTDAATSTAPIALQKPAPVTPLATRSVAQQKSTTTEPNRVTTRCSTNTARPKAKLKCDCGCETEEGNNNKCIYIPTQKKTKTTRKTHKNADTSMAKPSMPVRRRLKLGEWVYAHWHNGQLFWGWIANIEKHPDKSYDKSYQVSLVWTGQSLHYSSYNSLS